MKMKMSDLSASDQVTMRELQGFYAESTRQARSLLTLTTSDFKDHAEVFDPLPDNTEGLDRRVFAVERFRNFVRDTQFPHSNAWEARGNVMIRAGEMKERLDMAVRLFERAEARAREDRMMRLTDNATNSAVQTARLTWVIMTFTAVVAVSAIPQIRQVVCWIIRLVKR